MKQASPPRRPPGSSLTSTGANAAVAPTATQFQAIEAHPVSQAGPVIGPYVQRTQTLATGTQLVTCVPQPRETLASWRATTEEMTHVIPTTSTAPSLSAAYGHANLGPVPRSQSVAPSQPTANMAHSAGLQIPQVPVRSGSSLSAPGELYLSAVSVNPQVSLSESTQQLQQKVQQDATQFQYQTDQRTNYLEERRYPHQQNTRSHNTQNMTLQAAPTNMRYAHSDAQTLPPTHRMASSTVSFMTRTNEALNVIQPRLNSFTQPQHQQTQHIGQYVHSDTVYSDPASENRNRYAKAKEQPTRHAVRRSTQEYRE